MKKVYMYLGIVLAACLSSCTDENLDNGVKNPVHTGDEILFGSSLSDNANMIETRTVYGDRTSTGVPVEWVTGDKIAIFCPQASQPASKLVTYNVTPDEEDASTASKVEVDFTASEVGLQWGSSDEHRFYGFYPASAVKETVENDPSVTTDGRILAHVPVEQDVEAWRYDKEGMTSSTDQSAHIPTWFGLPNMDLAYMYAYTSVDKNKVGQDQKIDLKFHNLLTVLDITIPGPENADSVVVTAINVDDVSGEQLALTGDFYCYMRDGIDNHKKGDCEPVNDPSKVNNRIAISTYNPATKKFISLKKGEQINVKAYIIPHTGESIGKRQLQVSVVPLNGVAKRKLLQTSDIKPSTINRVRLPHLEPGTETNYWMSNLDPNVYFTELSIPGSHQSVGLNNQSVGFFTYQKYQTYSIEQQFKDGIRAFSFQTTYNNDFQIHVYASGRQKDELYTYLKELATQLDNAKQAQKSDFAVVSIVFKDNSVYDDPDTWFHRLTYALTQDPNYANLPIYKDGITANTTIGELENKIVLRIDRKGTEEDVVPALRSEQPSTGEPAERPLYWETITTPQVLTMYAHDGTSIDVEGNSKGEIDNLSTKLGYVETIFNKSVDLYKANEAHNYFFHTNLGGFYCIDRLLGSLTNDAAGGTTTQYTEDIMPSVTDFIQRRGQDASLGVVLMNFADKQADSGARYGCDALIQTIINNNFTFALRKKASTTTTTYNAAYNRGGNAIGWDE